MGFSFHFSSLYPLSSPIHWIVCVLAYLNFRAVLVLPKMAASAQTHKSMSFIWVVWSTLYVYLWSLYKCSSGCQKIYEVDIDTQAISFDFILFFTKWIIVWGIYNLIAKFQKCFCLHCTLVQVVKECASFFWRNPMLCIIK